MKLGYYEGAGVVPQIQTIIDLGKYARGEIESPPNVQLLTSDLTADILAQAQSDGKLAYWVEAFAESLRIYQKLLDSVTAKPRKEKSVKRSMIREALVDLSICLK